MTPWQRRAPAAHQNAGKGGPPCALPGPDCTKAPLGRNSEPRRGGPHHAQHRLDLITARSRSPIRSCGEEVCHAHQLVLITKVPPVSIQRRRRGGPRHAYQLGLTAVNTGRDLPRKRLCDTPGPILDPTTPMSHSLIQSRRGGGPRHAHGLDLITPRSRRAARSSPDGKYATRPAQLIPVTLRHVMLTMRARALRGRWG
jgi:hypothetical protein